MEEINILRKVEAIVCVKFGVRPEWMHRTPRGKNYLTVPKQIVMTLARQIHKLPYACIGGFYGRNHEIAEYAEKAIENWCCSDREFRAMFEECRKLVSEDMPGLTDINVIKTLQDGIKTDMSDINARVEEIGELIKKLGINVDELK